MIICEKCFCDEEIVSVIQSHAQKGVCSVCGSEGVYIYDTDKCDDLSVMFDELIDIYTPQSSLPDTYPKSEIHLLKDELVKNWKIFNLKRESHVYTIITAICKDKYTYNPDVFDNPVGIKQLYDADYLSQYSLLGINSWDDFVIALKNKNRFHTHYLNLELLEKFFSYIRKSYTKGAIFYRCRISDKKVGIVADKMGAPPVELTSDGRANACGTRCLYLGDSVETTIYETRVNAYDYVTVGKFELKKDIIVVDLKKISQISPFIEGLDCLQYAINREHLDKINDEMGRIMRRSDSSLDYVPTQYIADFVKSISHDGTAEYSGIEYKSVMHKDGYNLAIFDPDLFECIETKVYGIDLINYDKHEL